MSAPPAFASTATVIVIAVGGGAAVAGLWWPDIDLWLGIGHRSGLTHSLLLPLLLWLAGARAPAAGLAGGIAAHLFADLFVADMRGFATITLPVADSIGRWASYAWLAANVMLGVAWLLWSAGRRWGAAGARGAAAALTGLALAYLLLNGERFEAVAALGGGAALAHPGARRALAARLMRRRP